MLGVSLFTAKIQSPRFRPASVAGELGRVYIIQATFVFVPGILAVAKSKPYVDSSSIDLVEVFFFSILEK